MELVVAIKDNISVGLELSSYIGPESLKVGCRSKDGAIISAKVVRIDDSMSSSGSDEAYHVGESSEVGWVEFRSHRPWS
jgi:hypothetical protein